MDFLKILANLFQNGGQHPQAQQAAPEHQVPVGQTLSQQDIGRLSPQTQQFAQIYNQNPQDPRVAHIDPSIFGYAPDNTSSSPIQVSKYPSGQNFNPQGNGVNPGYIPFQNSGFGGPGYAANLQPARNPQSRY